MKGRERAVVVAYSTARFPFAELVAREVFAVGELRALHDEARRRKRACNEPNELAYADNLAWRKLLENLADDHAFYELYHTFAHDVLAPRFHGRITYSAHPTFRVHLAGTSTVSRWHTDAQVTGRLDQINVWLPLVDASGSNTLWVEGDYDSGDYAPVAVRYGQALLFDGGLLRHGSVANVSPVTRVSIDFRFAPRDSADAHAILGGRYGFVPTALKNV
ncbi:MAG TPA: hypothetical protein VGT98_00155 [Candidatus Elarobacter sp.]|nr:hypothetical protein [Candidatus Elarobacter sp.]HEV2737027.1 hypothetical protein [Candidatus Elarobacter sp.]